MRITGGFHCSRKLDTPINDAVRPTSDKVRQAIFNMLQARDVLDDAVVIDAFSGTGALGLEALSRGASHSIFFDKSKESYTLTRRNIEVLKEEERTHAFLQDVTKVKEREYTIPQSSLVFLDPPYRKDLVPQAVEALLTGGWLEEGAVLVIETARDEKIQSLLINIESEKIYGDTKLMIASFVV